MGMALERDIPKAHYIFPPIVVGWATLLAFMREGQVEGISFLVLPGTIVFVWCEVMRRVLRTHWGGVGLYWSSILIGLHLV